MFGTLRPWVSMAEALGWGLTERPCVTIPSTTADSTGGPRPMDGGSGARATIERERERGALTLNTGRDWKPGGTRDDAQKRPLTEPAPAPALSAIAGPQWLLQPGKYAAVEYGNRRLYEPDEPAPTVAFGHDSAQWCWVRPATTIAGDPRCFQPGGYHEPGEQSENAVKLEPWEALLLMGMPMNHPLQGSRTAQFRQIGNGCCPPVVAAIVGELVGADWRAALDEVRGGR